MPTLQDVPDMGPDSRLHELQTLTGALSSTVSQWTGRFKNDIEALKATLESHDHMALSNRLTAVEGRLDSIQADVRALQNAQQTLQKERDVDRVIINGVHLTTADAVTRLLTRVEDLERETRTKEAESLKEQAAV